MKKYKNEIMISTGFIVLFSLVRNYYKISSENISDNISIFYVDIRYYIIVFFSMLIFFGCRGWIEKNFQKKSALKANNDPSDNTTS